MADITADATDHGTILLTVTSDTGQQGEADLSVELAEKLKAQIDIALMTARLRQIEAAIAQLPRRAIGAYNLARRHPRPPGPGAARRRPVS